MDVELALFGNSPCAERLSAGDLLTSGGARLRLTPWPRQRGSRRFSAAIIGESEADPLAAAQRAHRLNRDAPVLILRAPEELEDISQRLFLTPNIGQDTRVLPTGDDLDLACEIRSSADRAMRRQRYRKQTRSAMQRLAVPSQHPTEDTASTALLLEHLPMGVIGVDENQALLSCNPAACELLGLADPNTWHHPWYDLLPAKTAAIAEALIASALRTNEVRHRVLIAGDDTTRLFLDITAVPRPGTAGNSTALIMLHDVTERVHADLKRAHSERLLAESNQHLEQRVAARTRELVAAQQELQARNAELQRLYGIEEVNKAKSRFVSTISHEIRTPLHAILGLLGLMEQDTVSDTQLHRMRMIQESAENLRALIDNILDFSKLEAGLLELDLAPLNIIEMTESIADTVGATAEEKGLCLRLFADPTIPSALIGDSGRLRQILLNLAGNAVKFTHSGEVTLRCELVDLDSHAATLRFTVTDTGIGIAEQARERIFERFMQAEISTTRQFGGSGLGLSICRALVDAMGGQLELESLTGQGSRFTVAVTLARDAPTETTPPSPKPLSGLRAAVSSASAQEAADWRCYLEEAGAQLVPDAAVADVVLEDLSDHADLRVLARNAAGTVLLERPIRQRDVIEALTRRSGQAVPSPLADTKAPATPPLRGRVLIAEDNPVNQKVIQLQLERLGVDATIVDDGAAALRALAREHFDLLLADLHMPELDGFGLARAVREREGINPKSRLRIIALTASVERSELDHCVESGMDDVMTKPASLEEIQTALRRWLAQDPHAD